MAAHKSVSKKKKRRRKYRVRWGRLAILILIVLAIPTSLYLGLRYLFNPLSLKSDHYIAQYKETFNPLDNVKSVLFDSKENVTFNGTVDPETLGSTQVSYEYKGKKYPFTVEVKDIEGPELTLKDVKTDTTTTVTQNDFIESISDASQYSLRMDGNTDPGQSGTYKISISARDEFGNTTTKTAKLERKADTTAPTIENFEKEVTLLAGDYYKPGNYTVQDDLDQNPGLYVDSSALNTMVPGVYTVNYTTSDRSGNQKTYAQEVTIEENPDLGKKICYLTFDDGPSGVTQQVLDILTQYGVTGTFFVTAEKPEHFDMMKKVVDQGSTIALHTYSHDYSKLYASDEAYFEDLQQISDLVEQQTGEVSKVIRFPGGSSNMISADYNEGIMSRLVDEVEEKGYAYFDWNVDSTDASGNGVSVDQIVANATSGIGVDNAVILMHDTDAKETTVQALPRIIQAYKDAGYTFRPLTTRSTPVHHSVNN